MMLRSGKQMDSSSDRAAPEPVKIDFSKMKPRPISNLVLPKTTEQQLAEALATIKEKELEILELKNKLSKQEDRILGYFN